METLPPETRSSKPACSQADALTVLKRLRGAGHEAYFAGGCVRDKLLGLKPTDYDIATAAAPDQVRKLFPNTQAVGVAFGVILVRQNASVIEVATFRSDGAYADGRRPREVRFATAAEDAQRRDFTINGLFHDPLEDEIIDFVGGRDDLASRTLRAVGAAGKRFEEDHLRMLRAVRFAARFDLTLDPATAAGILHAAPRLKGISPERIADELRLMLTPATRARAWPLLWDLSLAPVIFRMFPPPLFPGPLFAAVAPGDPIPFPLALAAAAMDVQRAQFPDLQALLEKKPAQHTVALLRKTLRISNDESDAVFGALSGLHALLADADPPLAAKKRFLAQPTAPLSRRLLAALAQTALRAPRARQLEEELSHLEKTDFAPPPLLSGDDLTAAGFTPGPSFKRILDAVYDAQLEGRISTRQQALAMAGGS